MTLPQEFMSNIKALLNPEELAEFCKAYDNAPRRGLRHNLLKPAELPATPVPWCKSGKEYPESERPAKTIAYQAGLFYIQEPSAMLPAEILAPQPGDTILDLCAAPGGKSVQIAGHMQGSGLLVSNDASPTRSRALVKNLERAGVQNAIVLTEQPKKLARRFPLFFDKILVDAPCSGEGMFRRDKDTLKAYTANKPAACAATQKEILHQAAAMLKPGGRLVYSTCTFNTIENEEVISDFLQKHGDFTILEINHAALGVSQGRGNLPQAARIWPHLHPGEGHFAALLKKTGVSDNTPAIAKPAPPPPEFTAFINQYTTNRQSPPHANYITHGINLYRQQSPINLDGIRTARSGFHLGEISKNRFTPSQALAMALTTTQATHTAQLTEAESHKYLRGESLHLDDLTYPPTLQTTDNKPWVLIHHNQAPLGWARLVQERLKNNLPVGWVVK